MDWRVELLDDRVEDELKALGSELRAKFRRITQLLESFGPHRVKEPYVKPLEGKLWEMRLIGPDNIARAVYVAAVGKRLVVLRVFVKKTQKTPRHELEIARSRAQKAGLL